MRADLVDRLLCPRCGAGALRLEPLVVNRLQYGSRAIDEVEDGALHCHCGVTLPIQGYVLSYAALLPAEALDAARHWTRLFRLAWDRGIKGNFDLSEPVAPLLWLGILETAPQPEGERPGPHSVLAEHPLLAGCRAVLDIGCGPGSSALSLARRGRDVVAIDTALELLQLAKRHAIARGVFVEYLCAQLGVVRFRDASFDAAFALGSLHHMRGLGVRMGEIHGLLKVGGYLAVDDHHGMNRDTDAIAAALNRWVARDIAPGCRAEPPELMAAIETALAPHKCVSLGATVPEAERFFRVRHLETRYLFLDALAMACYLRRGKSPEAYDTARDLVETLSRTWSEVFPDWAEQVTFIGEKVSSTPAGPARRAPASPGESWSRRLAYAYWRGGAAGIGRAVRKRLQRRSRRPSQ